MIAWNSAPFFRLLLPFGTGILATIFFPLFPLNQLLVVVTFFTLIVSFFIISRFSRNYRISWLYGLLTSITLFFAGYQITVLKTEHFSNRHYLNYLEGTAFLHIRIISSGVEKEKSIKTIVECLSVSQNRKSISVSGKAMIYFQKNPQSLNLRSGDELIVKNKFYQLSKAKNPGEFDYQKFMYYKSIYRQAILKSTDWIHTGKNSCNYMMRISLNLRNKLLDIFKQANLEGDNFAVAAALLVGYTDKLDTDLLSAYSQTGALHVLSVSGLHVAIVFILFSRVLFFLNRFKYGILFKVLLLIFFLWFYALLSGLSPSVLRSAAMFSFIVFAKSLKKQSNIYNILSVSAFLLLLFNPYLLLDVGFQLSYLAVAGIVFIQPYAEQLKRTKSWLMSQIYDLISVSIAAQLATFPLSLYYFHQFPNYFLLSNLLVIPLSTVIMYLGIFLIAVSWNPVLLKYVSLLFSMLLSVLNKTIFYISQFPYAITNGIFISGGQMWWLYFILFTFFLFFIYKRLLFLKSFLIGSIVLMTSLILEQLKQMQQQKIIVYSIPGTSVIDFIYGYEHVIFVGGKAVKDPGTWQKKIKAVADELNLHTPLVIDKDVKAPFVCIKNGIIQFIDQKIVVVKECRKNRLPGTKLQVDYIIMTGDADVAIAEIKKTYAVRCIVFDSSNSFKTVRKWEKECITLGQSYYSVPDSGAFVWE